jgi:hypothetical protein
MDAGAGAGAGAPYASRTAEEVFRDFRGRRAGMIKALTHGRRPRPPLASGFSRPPAPASLTRLLCLLGWCFFFFAEVDKFYQLCDPGESARSPLL